MGDIFSEGSSWDLREERDKKIRNGGSLKMRKVLYKTAKDVSVSCNSVKTLPYVVSRGETKKTLAIEISKNNN